MRPDLVRARAFVAIGALTATLAGCTLGDSAPPPYTDPATQTYAAALNVDIATMTRVNSQVYQKDIVVGTGRVLAPGDSIEVYYKGNLTGGFNFDARALPATPFATRLDSTYIIKGWVLGLSGMKVGGKRKLVLGPESGYRYSTVRDLSGATIIPSNSVLVFDVELVNALPLP